MTVQPEGKRRNERPCKICGLKGKEKERLHKMIKETGQWDDVIKELKFD